MYMPQEAIGVRVMSPKTIVWYRILKQNVDRLRDAVNADEMDRRLECLFGFGGLTLGTARDAYMVVDTVANKEVPSLLELGLAMLCIVSASFVIYFWKFSKKKEASANKILAEIFQKEYEGDGEGASPQS